MVFRGDWGKYFPRTGGQQRSTSLAPTELYEAWSVHKPLVPAAKAAAGAAFRINT
jgi:hypothetical protein